MSEPAFLEAIVAEPDELAHRLVYADWLDERGDPGDQARAEFIRAQIARAALHPAHPDARALRRREEALLRQYGAAWSAPVAPLVRRCCFHRGFVEEVRLTVEQLLEHGPRLVRLAPLRRLQLRGTSLLPALLARAAHHARTLADVLARIKVLDLNRDYLGEAAGLALLDLPRLPKLEALHLAHNALSAGGVLVLAQSPVLAGLETLEFTPSAGVVEALQTLLHSPQLARLKYLSLANARLGDRVGRLLAGSPLLGRLRGLSLAHGQVSPTGLAALLSAPAAGGLRALDLAFNPLGPAGAQLLARWRPDTLSELNLSRTELGDAGVCALAGADLLGQLVWLDVSLNHVGAEGARALAIYPGPTQLLGLDLIYNPLGREARAALVRKFGEEVCLFSR
jgi:uncharacterized protein (TIGR02996 family)